MLAGLSSEKLMQKYVFLVIALFLLRNKFFTFNIEDANLILLLTKNYFVPFCIFRFRIFIPFALT